MSSGSEFSAAGGRSLTDGLSLPGASPLQLIQDWIKRSPKLAAGAGALVLVLMVLALAGRGSESGVDPDNADAQGAAEASPANQSACATARATIQSMGAAFIALSNGSGDAGALNTVRGAEASLTTAGASASGSIKTGIDALAADVRSFRTSYEGRDGAKVQAAIDSVGRNTSTLLVRCEQIGA